MRKEMSLEVSLKKNTISILLIGVLGSLIATTSLVGCTSGSSGNTTQNQTATMSLRADTNLGLSTNQNYQATITSLDGKVLAETVINFKTANGYLSSNINIDLPNNYYILKVWNDQQGLIAGTLIDVYTNSDNHNTGVFALNSTSTAGVVAQDVFNKLNITLFAGKSELYRMFGLNSDQTLLMPENINAYAKAHGISSNYSEFINTFAENIKSGKRFNYISSKQNTSYSNSIQLNSINNQDIVSTTAVSSILGDVNFQKASSGAGVEMAVNVISIWFPWINNLFQVYSSATEADIGSSISALSTKITTLQTLVESGFLNTGVGINSIASQISGTNAATYMQQYNIANAAISGYANQYSSLGEIYKDERGHYITDIDGILDAYLETNPTDLNFTNFTAFQTVLKNQDSIYSNALILSDNSSLSTFASSIYKLAYPTNDYDSDVTSGRVDLLQRRYDYNLVRSIYSIENLSGLDLAYSMDLTYIYLITKSKYADKIKLSLTMSEALSGTTYDEKVLSLDKIFETRSNTVISNLLNTNYNVSIYKDVLPVAGERGGAFANANYSTWDGTTLAGYCSHKDSTTGNTTAQACSLSTTDTGQTTYTTLCSVNSYHSGYIANLNGSLACAFESPVIFFATNSTYPEFGSSTINTNGKSTVFEIPVKTDGKSIDIKFDRYFYVLETESFNKSIIESHLDETGYFQRYSVTLNNESINTPTMIAQFYLTESQDAAYWVDIYMGGIKSSTDGKSYAYAVLTPVAIVGDLKGTSYTFAPKTYTPYLDTTVEPLGWYANFQNPDSGTSVVGPRVMMFIDRTVNIYAASFNTCTFNGKSRDADSSVCVIKDPTYRENYGHFYSASKTKLWWDNEDPITYKFRSDVVLDYDSTYYTYKDATTWDKDLSEKDGRNRAGRVDRLKLKLASDSNESNMFAIVFSGSRDSDWVDKDVYVQYQYIPYLSANGGADDKSITYGFYTSNGSNPGLAYSIEVNRGDSSSVALSIASKSAYSGSTVSDAFVEGIVEKTPTLSWTDTFQ